MKSAHILIWSNDSQESSRVTQVLEQAGSRVQQASLIRLDSSPPLHVDLTPFDLVILDPQGLDSAVIAEACMAMRSVPVPFVLLVPSEERLLQASEEFRQGWMDLHAQTVGRLGIMHRGAGAGEILLMVQSALQQYQEEGRRVAHERRLHSMLAGIPDAVISTDAHGAVTFLNAQAEKYTGWTLAEALQRPCDELLQVMDPGNGQPSPSPLTRCITERTPSRAGQCQFKTHSSDVRRVDYHAALIWDDQGQLMGSVLVLRDADEWDRWRENRHQGVGTTDPGNLPTPRRPEPSARHFDSFSYTIAHDLKAPLRAIHGFASLLKQSSSLVLDSEHQEFLGAIEANALRMDRMIDEYLRLARVSEGSLQKSVVDMEALILDVWADMARTHARPMPALQLGSLPMASGEPGLLRQVWFNLISNAVKFSSKNPSPSIEIGGESHEGVRCYWIRDNGVGFSTTQSDRLFIPFRRLHDPAEFPGVGVGLSLVHRIIQKHGGTIQAQGMEGQGALFRITLPASTIPTTQSQREAEGHHAE